MLDDDTLARRLARGEWEDAEMDEADREMLRYALLLTRDPAGVSRRDVERLRAVGFDDAAVLDVCQVTSYYNYANRLADGLGVELEERWGEEELVLTREEFDAIRRAAEG